jgi:uncharacterized protein
MTFLGGADGIGASSTLVEIAGHRVLVDCGIRQSGGGDPLPFLSRIDEVGGIDAILLTHAHIDHSGALPVVYPLRRDIPVYMTAATFDIVSILLRDALKIMGSGLEREGEVPLYSEAAVERSLSAVRKVPFLSPVELFPDDVRATFYPAGHILGASSIVLESTDGTVMFSGDVAVSDQLTVPGMMIPQGIRPDAVVVESTYGTRQHTSRSVEEERLVEQAEAITSRDGAVLFPAFAVGRAQEVLLVLQRAAARGDLKDVPIYVDGMVRQICGLYPSHGDIVTPWLRHRVERFGNPFFHAGSNTSAVVDPRKREKIATERPAIVVSSSGMLAGGPSQFYAQRFAGDPRCYIGITGYQDEESPGRHLQDVARAGSGSLRLGTSVVELACGVGTYGLSAHADASQVLRIIQALEPENAVFVHGDAASRDALAAAAQLHGVERAHLPGVGDEIEVRPSRRRRRPQREGSESRPGAAGRQLDEASLYEIASALLTRDGPHAWYTIDEILKAGGYPGAVGDVDERNRARDLLAASDSPFVRDRKRYFMWRVRTGGGERSGDGEPDWKARLRQRMEETAARQHAKTLFPEDAGLYQVSAFARTNTLILAFDFPTSARERFAAQIERVETETGWRVTVRDEPHQAALADAALAALPTGLRATRQPSIFQDERTVTVRVDGEPESPDALASSAEAFRALTGFALRFEPNRASGRAPRLETLGEGARLDQASAQQFVRDAFPPEAGLYRISVLTESSTLVLAFHFPHTVRERFPESFARLERETGWTVTVREEAHLGELSDAADAALPPGLRPLKRPSVRHDLRRVTLRVEGASPPDVVEAAVAAYRGLTGYELRLEWL